MLDPESGHDIHAVQAFLKDKELHANAMLLNLMCIQHGYQLTLMDWGAINVMLTVRGKKSVR